MVVTRLNFRNNFRYCLEVMLLFLLYYIFIISVSSPLDFIFSVDIRNPNDPR